MPPTGRGLFLRAEADIALDATWKDKLLCVQGFKPLHDVLQSRGFETATHYPADRQFDLVLLRLTKHKLESLGLIAQGLAALAAGGILHVAGAKDEGIESIEKLLKAKLGPVATRSKHHGRTFWLQKPDSALPLEISGWADALQPQNHMPEYLTAPGMFSFDRVDRGSKLLAEHLLPVIKGRVADFGAGWGYLAREVLARCPSVQKLDLYEAEASALDCAKLNLANAGLENADKPVSFQWADIARGEVPASTYDFIVMNPPFHAGKTTQASLGQTFIQSAAKAMRPGGRLFMVANRQLPYEPVLKAAFSNVRLVVEADGFKVFDAKR